ncbi:hypothetical protein OCAE111667_09170 [Occultella aeris]|uniref:Uncharacterized protein n=1 Tax=Occultella aeris TaxID=2761496 RepID=A0A7M4DJU7_9MICO|nr:hypothetical protein [Occultella aeris]VZO37332.1 hypothetical protein HALOF300_02405 [Occultella aeris]
MSSALLTDPRAVDRTAHEVTDLLVLWQHPTSREICPIGRLEHVRDEFQFAYTVAAGEIEGFRPLPGLPDLERQYRSGELPLVLGQRILVRARPDYDEYVRSLGLDPEFATPWEQIVRSGGHREGDTLQVMELPRVREGRAQATFFGNAVRWIARNELRVDGVPRRVSVEEQERALHSLTEGDPLSVRRDEGNAFDADACLLLAGETPVARVPRVLASAFKELLGAGDVTVRVVRLGDANGPPHLRLTVGLDVPAPDGFEFDRQGRWEPLRTA